MRLTVLALAVLSALPASAQVAILEPVDEAAQDPSFILFRARLLEAAQARDTAFVLSALDPNIKFSFGADDGIEPFRLYWLSGMRPEGEDLWSVLTRTVALGSTYQAGEATGEATATAPYIFDAWPSDVDAFEHLAVVGESVRVRAAPSIDAETISALTYSIVPTLYVPDLDPAWRRITLADGRTGYVAARFLRSPIDHRVGFVKSDGQWRIRFFVAGD